MAEGFFAQFKDDKELGAFVEMLKDIVKEAMREIHEPPSHDVLQDRISKRAMLKDISNAKLRLPEMVRTNPMIYTQAPRPR